MNFIICISNRSIADNKEYNKKESRNKEGRKQI